MFYKLCKDMVYKLCKDMVYKLCNDMVYTNQGRRLCRERPLTMGWAGITCVGGPTLRSVGVAR